MALAVASVPVLTGTLWCYSRDYSEAMVLPVGCSAQNLVMVLDALQVLGYFTHSGV